MSLLEPRGQVSILHTGNFPLLTVHLLLLMEEWHCMAKDLLFWGCDCDTAGHGQKGIWHTSFVDKQGACKEAVALPLKAIAMARVKRQKLVFLLPQCLDVKNESCPLPLFFFLVGFFSPNSSAVGTPSLETGKHPYSPEMQQQQFILLAEDISLDTAA